VDVVVGGDAKHSLCIPFASHLNFTAVSHHPPAVTA
jgi:hypothetical protein